jgi:hypothetical protein
MVDTSSSLTRVSFADFVSRYGPFILRDRSDFLSRYSPFSCSASVQNVIYVYRCEQDTEPSTTQLVASLMFMRRIDGVSAAYSVHTPPNSDDDTTPIEMVVLSDHLVHVGSSCLLGQMIDVEHFSFLSSMPSNENPNCDDDRYQDEIQSLDAISLRTFFALHRNALVAFEGGANPQDGSVIAYLLHPEIGFVLATLVLEYDTNGSTEENVRLRMRQVCEAPSTDRPSDEEFPAYQFTQWKLELLRTISSVAERMSSTITTTENQRVWTRSVDVSSGGAEPFFVLTRDKFLRLHVSLPHDRNEGDSQSVPFSMFRNRFGPVKFIRVKGTERSGLVKYKIVPWNNPYGSSSQGFLVRRFQHSQFATYTVLGPDDFTIVFASIQLADYFVNHTETVLHPAPSGGDEDSSLRLTLDDVAWVHGGLLLDYAASSSDVYFARHVHTGRPMYTFCKTDDNNNTEVILDPLLHVYRPRVFEASKSPLMKRALSMARRGNQHVLRCLSPEVLNSFASVRAKLSRQVAVERAHVAPSINYEVERCTKDWTQDTWVERMCLKGSDEVGWLNGTPDARRQCLRWIQQSVGLPGMALEDIQAIGTDLKTHLKTTCSFETTAYNPLHTDTLEISRNDFVRCSEGLEAVARGYVNGTTAYELYGGVTLRQSMYGRPSSVSKYVTRDASWKAGGHVVHNTMDERQRIPLKTTAVDYTNATYSCVSKTQTYGVVNSTDAHVHVNTTRFSDSETIMVNAGVRAQRRWVTYNTYTYQWIAYNPYIQKKDLYVQEDTTPTADSQTLHRLHGRLDGAFYEKQYRDPNGKTVRFQTFSADVEGETTVNVSPHSNMLASTLIKPVHRHRYVDGSSSCGLTGTTTVHAKGSIGLEMMLSNPGASSDTKTNSPSEKMAMGVFGTVQAGVSSRVERIGLNADYTYQTENTGVSIGGNVYRQQAVDDVGQRSTARMGAEVSLRFDFPEPRCMRQTRTIEESLCQFDEETEKLREQRQNRAMVEQSDVANNLPPLSNATDNQGPNNMRPSGASSSSSSSSSAAAEATTTRQRQSQPRPRRGTPPSSSGGSGCMGGGSGGGISAGYDPDRGLNVAATYTWRPNFN